MIPERKNLEEPTDRVQDDALTSAEQILLEIREDARRLKGRYSKETVVPEGGE